MKTAAARTLMAADVAALSTSTTPSIRSRQSRNVSAPTYLTATPSAGTAGRRGRACVGQSAGSWAGLHTPALAAANGWEPWLISQSLAPPTRRRQPQEARPRTRKGVDLGQGDTLAAGQALGHGVGACTESSAQAQSAKLRLTCVAWCRHTGMTQQAVQHETGAIHSAVPIEP